MTLGRGGGQVVRVLGVYSDDPSSNPAEAYSFSVKFVFENKQKEAGVGPFFLKNGYYADDDLKCHLEWYRSGRKRLLN